MRRERHLSKLDALVIGAGMAGVAAARELSRQGLAVAVVEGRDRTGGRVSSVRDFCGEPVEGGAEFIHTGDAAIWPEVRAAGVGVRACPLARNSMFNLGGRTRWLPWLLLHPGVWPAFPILRQLRRVGPEDMSAAEFIERHGFRGRARILAEMTLTAHLPGSIDDVGVRGLLEDRVLHLETGSYHRVVDGYDRLTDHIGRGLDVQLGFAVETVRWAPDGVSVVAGDGRELSARAAISTLPLGVLKSGAVRFVPELPKGKRLAFTHLEMGPVLKLLLRFREPFWPRWLTNLGCGAGPVTLYWPVFYGVPSKPAVLTAYCTGPRAARLAQLGEHEAVDAVLADLHRLFPRADPCAFHAPLRAAALGATRCTGSGSIVGREQTVPYEDWLRAYTAGAAHAGGQEHERGSLTPGKRADLVVLEGNLDAAEPPRVVETWVAGQRVHAAA